MAKRERERASFSSTKAILPVVLSSTTSERFILEIITPHLRQLSDLSNQAVSSLAVEDVAELGQRHAKFLSLYMGICIRMAFDHLTFAEKGTLGFSPIEKSCIVPSSANEHTVIVFCCASDCDVIQVDQSLATFRGPNGEKSVCVKPQHILGNLFSIAVPSLPFLNGPTKVEVHLSCGLNVSTVATVELSVAPRVQVPLKPYTAFRQPLHYAAFSGDVVLALGTLDRCSSAEARKVDDFGTEPAALALFHGNRVMYALLVWKALNWPAIAVCQLLRARMELESGLIDGSVFQSVREGIHDLVSNSLPGITYRPIQYQIPSSAASSYRGPLAVMLLPEVPYLGTDIRDNVANSAYSLLTPHRRGSLDVLLQAIEACNEAATN